ncbi:MAG: bifunctional demethylmenaquinone methyltransferase/2-methoxy-6-polyprenyl-1,4-benzoquinol methylase UbiE [Campylobacteraceae bacterium]|jgi:demethylmenaquinone methyltransferase/2-methoxy-6-polyprenyl-1,4-benzoquinol methylase|nr:bifunctional demethylmenaquinone methyltransferase/2-methoxy-6-polyprenyl-1,4-benzoquinol methylase UbiE [Campylobacteraceae bacterium]
MVILSNFFLKELFLDTDNRQVKIVQMFDDIASTYDKANRVLSMGIDVSWRKKACSIAFDKLNQKEIKMIIDVACGTGDMISFWQKYSYKKGVKVKRILGVDPSSQMLNIAKKKFENFDFIKACANNIPLPNECADIVSISYGIRNVLKRKEAFREFARVIKKGGFVVILEFTKEDKNGVLQKIKQFYLNKILPSIGGFISKNYEAYKYLPSSIDGFLTSSMLQEELTEVGFKIRYAKSFSMNISTLIIAEKC